jgi:hypothetical protein
METINNDINKYLINFVRKDPFLFSLALDNNETNMTGGMHNDKVNELQEVMGCNNKVVNLKTKLELTLKDFDVNVMNNYNLELLNNDCVTNILQNVFMIRNETISIYYRIEFMHKLMRAIKNHHHNESFTMDITTHTQPTNKHNRISLLPRLDLINHMLQSPLFTMDHNYEDKSDISFVKQCVNTTENEAQELYRKYIGQYDIAKAALLREIQVFRKFINEYRIYVEQLMK